MNNGFDLKEMLPMMRALGLSPEQLGPDKMELLQKLSKKVSDPSNMNYESAGDILRSLGVGLGEPKPKKRRGIKIGRNELCICDSGIKFKKCCGCP
jgi:uncharacterized protein YecA (UPF0149 family)